MVGLPMADPQALGAIGVDFREAPEPATRFPRIPYTGSSVSEKTPSRHLGEYRFLSNLAQAPGLYFIDEPANAVLVRYERARFYAPYRLAHVLFQVRERL